MYMYMWTEKFMDQGCNNMRYVDHTHVCTEKFSIEHTIVGLAHAHANICICANSLNLVAVWIIFLRRQLTCLNYPVKFLWFKLMLGLENLSALQSGGMSTSEGFTMYKDSSAVVDLSRQELI